MVSPDLAGSLEAQECTRGGHRRRGNSGAVESLPQEAWEGTCRWRGGEIKCRAIILWESKMECWEREVECRESWGPWLRPGVDKRVDKMCSGVVRERTCIADVLSGRVNALQDCCIVKEIELGTHYWLSRILFSLNDNIWKMLMALIGEGTIGVLF